MQKYILLFLMLPFSHLLTAQVDTFKEISTPDMLDVLIDSGFSFDKTAYSRARKLDSLFKISINKYNNGKYKDAISTIVKNERAFIKGSHIIKNKISYLAGRVEFRREAIVRDNGQENSKYRSVLDSIDNKLHDIRHVDRKIGYIFKLRTIYIHGVKSYIYTNIENDDYQYSIKHAFSNYYRLEQRFCDAEDILFNDLGFRLELNNTQSFLNNLLIDIYANLLSSTIRGLASSELPEDFFLNLDYRDFCGENCQNYFPSNYPFFWPVREFPQTDSLEDVSNASYQFNANHFGEKVDSIILYLPENNAFNDCFEQKYNFASKMIAYFTVRLAVRTHSEDFIKVTESSAFHIFSHHILSLLKHMGELEGISERQLIRVNHLKALLYFQHAAYAFDLSRIMKDNKIHYKAKFTPDYQRKKAIAYLDTMRMISSKLYPLEGEHVSLQLESLRCLNALAGIYNETEPYDCSYASPIHDEYERYKELGDIYTEKYSLPIMELVDGKAKYVAYAVKKTNRDLEKVKHRSTIISILLFVVIPLLLYTFWRVFRARSQLSSLQIETEEKALELTTLEQDFGKLTEAHKIIRTQKSEVDETNKQLQLEQYRVNKYRRAMSHRIKNGLGGISSRLDLINAKIIPTENDATLQVIKEIKSRVNTMIRLHILLNQEEGKPVIDLKDFIGKMRDIYNMYNDYEAGNYHFEAIDFSLPLRPEIVQDMGLIIDELISNAWVHSRYRPRYLKVLILKIDEKLIIEVQDAENIYNKNKEIIYDRSTKNKLRKASDESQKSKGHTIITNIARRYKGTFGRICNDDGIGSNYFVHFNINNLDYE